MTISCVFRINTFFYIHKHCSKHIDREIKLKNVQIQSFILFQHLLWSEKKTCFKQKHDTCHLEALTETQTVTSNTNLSAAQKIGKQSKSTNAVVLLFYSL